MSNELWDRLRRARKAQGMTQNDVAEHMRLSRVAVGFWETTNEEARTSPSTAQLMQLAKLYRVPLSWLIEGDQQFLVSRSDATLRDAHHIGVRRVRIEGSVEMDENGFWAVGSDEAEEASYPTEDPDAYAIRVNSQRFKPVVSLSQCLLVSPRAPLRAGRPVVVTMADGRKTLRTFLSHESGVWSLTSVNDANDYLDLEDESVFKVERIMAYMWTD